MPPDFLHRQLELLSADERDIRDSDLLALWFLRTYLAVSDLDSYEFVREELQQIGADAFAWEQPSTPESPPKLLLIKVVRAPEALDRAAVAGLAQAVHVLARIPDLRHSTERVIPAPITTHLARIYKGRRESQPLASPTVAGALVSDQPATDEVTLAARRSSVEIFDAERLDTIARAVAGPALINSERQIAVEESQRLVTSVRGGRVVVCPVPASEIVSWPGIEDRSLFDLNVRFALGAGRVRASLDRAIKDEDAHSEFLASHNGLTVLCSRIRLAGDLISIRGLSVVNGAQTVIAFQQNAGELSPDLKVFVKFVEVDPASDFAREIAIRSNTQNPVTSRNLRALDTRQLLLKQEFEEAFPHIEYVTRPDIGVRSDGTRIRNDDAAQWLAAVYNEMPWLAVKRDFLFRGETYKTVFSSEIDAAHVLFCWRIREAVEASRPNVPQRYRGSWRLTALVLMYLVGQLLRTDDHLRGILKRPEEAVNANGSVSGLLDALASHGTTTLTENLAKRGAEDDFKVDFKSQGFLKRLGTMSRGSFQGV